jgi:hypothetical protein
MPTNRKPTPRRVKHYTGAEVTFTPSIAKLDDLARQVRARKATASHVAVAARKPRT